MQRRTDGFDSLIRELSFGRGYTDRLFERVPHALFYERPIPERHRILFYLGHLDAFDLNLLWRERNGQRSLSALDRLFAFGIDPVDGALPTDAAQDWPALAEIREYVKRARARLDRWLSDSPSKLIDGVPLGALLNAAIEHRLMHAETLAYMLNRLPIAKPLRAVPTNRRELSDDMVPIPAGVATLGARIEDEAFGWDNEYQAHQVEVAAFEVDRYMVTNARFLSFVEADGYSESRWWRTDDWRWLQSRKISHPAAWRRENGEWRQLSVVDEVPLQGDWPVYVSYAEASAYAKWSGKQLPTEAQWHRAAYSTPSSGERSYPWGEAPPTKEYGNFNFAQWDPAPVDAHPSGASAFGVVDLVGNGWEWTTTPFASFAGFERFSFYPGYSADFFDGRHFVLKGGSPHTAARLLRRSFRNWFQPHYPYPFAGFRCVRPK